MPKAKATDTVKWGDPPSARNGRPGKWELLLQPFVRNPGRWGKFFTANSLEQAQQTVNNLNRRNVKIPRPKDDWTFLSRECEVFAIYRKKAKSARVRRTQRKR